MELNDYYQERGIVKYQGFFLSEHTSTLTKDEYDRYNIMQPKDELDESTIFEILNDAVTTHAHVSIQLNFRDIEGNFMPDITGQVKGHDECNIYIDDYKMRIDQVRHIEIIRFGKWFQS